MEVVEKKEIKARITTEIERVCQQIEDLKKLTQPIAPDCAIGRISRMEAINNKSVNEHLLEKTQSRLKKLESSLSFIESDDYGNCRVCKQPIPLGRLLMLPESDKCVNCA